MARSAWRGVFSLARVRFGQIEKEPGYFPSTLRLLLQSIVRNTVFLRHPSAEENKVIYREGRQRHAARDEQGLGKPRQTAANQAAHRQRGDDL